MTQTDILSTLECLKNLKSNNFFLIAGPCVVEGEEICMQIAEKLVNITDSLRIPFIFKSLGEGSDQRHFEIMFLDGFALKVFSWQILLFLRTDVVSIDKYTIHNSHQY